MDGFLLLSVIFFGALMLIVAKSWGVGAPAWVTVKVWPWTVTLPERLLVPVLASTV